MDATSTAVVVVRPHPQLISGNLSAEDFQAVAAWIALNQQPLIDYWNGTLSTVEFVDHMRPLSVPPAG